MLRSHSTRPHRCPRLSLSAAGLVLALSCAPWASIPTPAPGVLPPSTRLQVWIGHRAMVLRDVRISVDSIRGRAVGPLGAQSAAWLVIPRAEVDSFRIRPPDRDNWFGAGVAAGLLSGIVGTLAFCRAAAGD
jgi:hypothetical protein